MSEPKDVRRWAEIRQEPGALVQTDPAGSDPEVENEELDLAAFAPALPPTHQQLGENAPKVSVKAPAKHPGKFASKVRVAKGPGKASGKGAAKTAKAWARSKGKKVARGGEPA